MPLRLNAARYDLRATPGVAPDADAAVRLEAHLLDLCPPWAGAGRRFVAAYFEHLRGALATNAERVAARLAPFAGLYAPGDWLYSGLAPLPRAHLPVDGTTIRVDFAFWRGDGLAAALASDSNLTPRRMRERDEALVRAGVEVVRFGPDEIGPALFGRLLGPAHAAFWEAEPIPSGPFAPAILDGEPLSRAGEGQG